MSEKKYRPQNKNLIPINDRPEADAFAIRSAGGTAHAEKLKKKRAMQEVIEMYSKLPIADKRVINRLKRLGVLDEYMTQQLQIADALMKSAKNGNIQAITLYLEVLGELGKAQTTADGENNLFEMIEQSSSQEVSVDDLSEIYEAPTDNADLVESPESETP